MNIQTFAILAVIIVLYVLAILYLRKAGTCAGCSGKGGCSMMHQSKPSVSAGKASPCCSSGCAHCAHHCSNQAISVENKHLL